MVAAPTCTLLDRPLPTSIDAVPHTQYRSAYGRYFTALGIRLIKGRLLDEHDQAKTTPYGSLEQAPESVVYGSILQHDASSSPSFAVRTEGDPTALVSSIRGILAQLDKNLPLANVATIEEVVSDSVAQPRFQTILLGIFGGLAIVLGAVGIYGVMSYSVSQRTSEIGVRMALGANRWDILGMICKQGLSLAAVGLARGWPRRWA
jgi:predicted lysophospholipase L1 biosynthesis ABC-type transport system permease subunit